VPVLLRKQRTSSSLAPLSPLTGKYAQNGANTKNGYDLAVAEINEKGGIDIAGKN
jgi:ABC-type branched-subunit amino acid transport system substrate-binding protein